MEDLANILGIVGTYFAVLLVLAVAIETVIEPIKFFKGLRKKISPEQALKDVKEWLPEGSTADASAISIANIISEYEKEKDEFETLGNNLKARSAKAMKDFGMSDEEIKKLTDTGNQKLAIMLAEVRKRYAANEEMRIIWLRLLSGILGLAIAYLLQLDTFVLLGELTADFLEGLSANWKPVVHIFGIFITGVAASAGSSFWHDQLGRVRAIKETAKQVQETAEEIKNTLKIEVSSQVPPTA